MLVITRKTGEGLVLGDNIVLTLLEVGKDRVKLGIEAPQSVRIIRSEIADTEAQNRESAQPPSKEALEAFLKKGGQ